MVKQSPTQASNSFLALSFKAKYDHPSGRRVAGLRLSDTLPPHVVLQSPDYWIRLTASGAVDKICWQRVRPSLIACNAYCQTTFGSRRNSKKAWR